MDPRILKAWISNQKRPSVVEWRSRHQSRHPSAVTNTVEEPTCQAELFLLPGVNNSNPSRDEVICEPLHDNSSIGEKNRPPTSSVCSSQIPNLLMDQDESSSCSSQEQICSTARSVGGVTMHGKKITETKPVSEPKSVSPQNIDKMKKLCGICPVIRKS